ncbi:hypothetical protein MMPV_000315 [Pyropia vietnamensis]
MERSLTLAQRAFSLGAAAIALVGVASVVHFGVSVRSHVRWAPKDDDAGGGDASGDSGPTQQAPIFRIPADGDAPASAAATAAAATAADRTGRGGGGALASELPPTAAIAPGDAVRDAASGSGKS